MSKKSRTRVLPPQTRVDELESPVDRLHTILLRVTLLNFVLGAMENDRHSDPVLHEALQELAVDIDEAARGIAKGGAL